MSSFRDELLEAGLLVASGVDGVYGFGSAFEQIREGFARRVVAAAVGDNPETLRFPPLVPRVQIETSGYAGLFPHLLGSVFVFEGDERAAAAQAERAAGHDDWSEFQTMSDLVLVPAACYPVYPAIAARGPVAGDGMTIDVGGAWVFRHEPSEDPARMQSFHMHELVRIGPPAAVLAWRERWRERGLELLAAVGLDVMPAEASDPFFGRGGRMLAANQRGEGLKYELSVTIDQPEPTAVASFNYHRDHFALVHGLTLADGSAAHTACLGFGEERVALALLRAHGLDPARWPSAVRAELWGN